MPISNNNIVLLKSMVVNDTAQNGGAMSSTVVASGVKNNIFPDVPKSERTAGSTKYRKLFYALRNSDNTAGIDAKLFILQPSLAGDAVLILNGNTNETRADITTTTRRYGFAELLVSAVAGDVTVTVKPEQYDYQVFLTGDTIAITRRNEYDSSTPLDYYTVIGVAVSGADIVLTLNRPLDNPFVIGSTVASVIESQIMAADIVGTSTASNSTVNDNHILFSNAGTIDGTWTLTFTSSTTFTLTCNSLLGYSTNGSISGMFSPSNPITGSPYFILETAFFNGNYATGNTISFQTKSASMPFWLERIIPPNTTYLSGNSVVLGFELESE